MIDSMDLIDLMGPEATREDYEVLLRIVQDLLADPEFGNDDDI